MNRLSLIPWLLASLLVASGAIVEPLPAQDEERKANSSASDEEKERQREVRKKARQAMGSALPAEITSAFPIGREFVDVSIPSYEEDTLKSVMTANSITRINDQYLELINLVISVYNAEGEVDTTIHMDEAAYDLTTQTLQSKTPARIEQPQFTMSGDTLTFDTKSQFSRLEGNVVVIIPDVGNAFPVLGMPFNRGK
ncbi:LPS export ABC transporter periplasmic protein LptC [Verrucomicrobiales bacterium]|nr:LPS export ABC transporter periplasmic protein LptC [Verrucomicrobiales bacterium]MDC3352775.1 LPS export ABC transporter periplasmic protein LptC [Verrucomicrobiales bacterium]